MSMKKILCAALATAGVALSVSAYAEDLIIDNDTNQPSTSRINAHKPLGGLCTAYMPFVKGVTPPKNKNPTPLSAVNTACILDRTNCRADVYMTNNCTGPIISTVIMDVKKGIKSATQPPADTGYHIEYSGFYIKLSGGPALAAR